MHVQIRHTHFSRFDVTRRNLLSFADRGGPATLGPAHSDGVQLTEHYADLRRDCVVTRDSTEPEECLE